MKQVIIFYDGRNVVLTKLTEALGAKCEGCLASHVLDVLSTRLNGYLKYEASLAR